MRLTIQLSWARVWHNTRFYAFQCFFCMCAVPLYGIIRADMFFTNFPVAVLDLNMTEHKLLYIRYISMCWGHVWHNTLPYSFRSFLFSCADPVCNTEPADIYPTHSPVAVFGLSAAIVVVVIIIIHLFIILVWSQMRTGKLGINSGEARNQCQGETSLSTSHNLLWRVPSNIKCKSHLSMQ